MKRLLSIIVCFSLSSVVVGQLVTSEFLDEYNNYIKFENVAQFPENVQRLLKDKAITSKYFIENPEGRENEVFEIIEAREMPGDATTYYLKVKWTNGTNNGTWYYVLKVKSADNKEYHIASLEMAGE